MSASLLPREDDSLEAKEIVRRIVAAFPDAVVDWARGDRLVDESVQELIAWRVPEVIVEAARCRRGQVAFVSVSYVEWPSRSVTVHVHPVREELGDWLDLHAEPFDIGFLIHGARTIASALDFGFHLEYEATFEVRCTPSPCADPLDFANSKYAQWGSPRITVVPLGDWRSSLHTAIVKWLAVSNHKGKAAATREFATPDAFAHAAVSELNAISPVRRAWSVDALDASHQNAILLDQGQWTSFVDLGGVPKGIVS